MLASPAAADNAKPQKTRSADGVCRRGRGTAVSTGKPRRIAQQCGWPLMPRHAPNLQKTPTGLNFPREVPSRWIRPFSGGRCADSRAQDRPVRLWEPFRVPAGLPPAEAERLPSAARPEPRPPVPHRPVPAHSTSARARSRWRQDGRPEHSNCSPRRSTDANGARNRRTARIGSASNRSSNATRSRDETGRLRSRCW